jgi:hypothetical protein
MKAPTPLEWALFFERVDGKSNSKDKGKSKDEIRSSRFAEG